MELLIKRYIYNDSKTTGGEANNIGDFFIDGVFFCYSLEDQIRYSDKKVYGKTAIPDGRYKVILTSDRNSLTDEDLQGLPYSTVKELVTAFCPILKTMDSSPSGSKTKSDWFGIERKESVSYTHLTLPTKRIV